MTSKKQINKLITQLDYIKVLLEENRMGEALNYVNILSNGLEIECENIANDLNNTDNINITKIEAKIKPGNWLNLHDTWFKLVERDINDKSMVLEVSKNIKKIKTKYSIINEK